MEEALQALVEDKPGDVVPPNDAIPLASGSWVTLALAWDVCGAGQLGRDLPFQPVTFPTEKDEPGNKWAFPRPRIQRHIGAIGVRPQAEAPTQDSFYYEKAGYRFAILVN